MGTYIALAASVIINIVLAIVLIVTLTGKDAKSEDDEDDKSYTESASVEEQLLGTWEVTNDSVLKLTFCDDVTCIAAGYDTNDYYEYEIDGSTLVMTMDGYTKRFEYSLSGNSLILTDKSGERLSLIKK